MSLFDTKTLPCPSCGEPVTFPVVFSVNADRRPDLRDAIVDGSFQREACGSCGESFRMAPEFTYLDFEGGLWLAVFPLVKLLDWHTSEAAVADTYDRAFGARASKTARILGADLRPRLVFGWAALREKIVAAHAGIDDTILELVKLALLRSRSESSLSNAHDLRLGAVDGDHLVMAWVHGQTEAIEELLKVPRGIIDDIAENADAWAALRAEVSDGLFVDIKRMIVVPRAAG